MDISKRILMQMIAGVITAAYLRGALSQETAASAEIKLSFPPIPNLALPDFGVAPGAWESLSAISAILLSINLSRRQSKKTGQ